MENLNWESVIGKRKVQDNSNKDLLTFLNTAPESIDISNIVNENNKSKLEHNPYTVNFQLKSEGKITKISSIPVFSNKSKDKTKNVEKQEQTKKDEKNEENENPEDVPSGPNKMRSAFSIDTAALKQKLSDLAQGAVSWFLRYVCLYRDKTCLICEGFKYSKTGGMNIFIEFFQNRLLVKTAAYYIGWWKRIRDFESLTTLVNDSTKNAFTCQEAQARIFTGTDKLALKQDTLNVQIYVDCNANQTPINTSIVSPAKSSKKI